MNINKYIYLTWYFHSYSLFLKKQSAFPITAHVCYFFFLFRRAKAHVVRNFIDKYLFPSVSHILSLSLSHTHTHTQLATAKTRQKASRAGENACCLLNVRQTWTHFPPLPTTDCEITASLPQSQSLRISPGIGTSTTQQ